MAMNTAQELQAFSSPLSQPLAPNSYTSSFSTIRQGNFTNSFTKLRPRAENTEVDDITGAALVKQGDLVITFPQFDGLQGLKTSTYRLLDAMTVALTESGAKSPLVTISLEEYMRKCGLSDRKEARKQANADLEALFNIRATYKEKSRRGRKRDPEGAVGYLDMRICEAKGISRSGIITFTFGGTFFNILKGYPVMPYPPQLWRLSSKYNPNSYYLLRKISEHKNMNAGKKNEDTISVKTLLDVAVYLPTYEEVMSGNRNVSGRIIEPFERDMDALDETLTWEYCHTNGVPLTDQEAAALDYGIFSKLNVRIHWRDYPDQTARLEAKAEKAARARKKATPRKKKAEEGSEE